VINLAERCVARGVMFGVRDGEIASVRARLNAFAMEIFAGLTRSDQRLKGELYLRGLLLDGRRKSIRTMARRLGTDYQALQQFVTSSTWDVASVRLRLARRAVDVVRPVAWVLEDTAFLKEGTGSPCVTKQYASTVERVANCQIGVSVRMVGHTGSAAVNWRLSVPESWDETTTTNPAERAGIARRRRRCGIPNAERHRPNWVIALEMIDELVGWDLRPPIVVAGRHYGAHDEFRAALERLGMRYVVQVEPDSVVTLLGPPATTTTVRDIVRASEASTRQRDSRPGPVCSSFVVRSVHDVDPTPTPLLLIAEWPDGGPEPTRYWVTNTTETSDLKPLAQLPMLRAQIHRDYPELHEVVGLDHFEGRSWIGWNRHVTLASAAHLFLTALRTPDSANGMANDHRNPETSGVA
jgi:SRSO17 transposase